jgi:hypothetical protein
MAVASLCVVVRGTGNPGCHYQLFTVENSRMCAAARASPEQNNRLNPWKFSLLVGEGRAPDRSPLTARRDFL